MTEEIELKKQRLQKVLARHERMTPEELAQSDKEHREAIRAIDAQKEELEGDTHESADAIDERNYHLEEISGFGPQVLMDEIEELEDEQCRRQKAR